MKMALVHTCLALAATSFPVLALLARERASTNPVAKVLEMLEDMKATGHKELKIEKATYATYSAWVDDRSRELEHEIKTAENEVSQLTEAIEQYDSDSDRLTANIAKLNKEVKALEEEKASATNEREVEHAAYDREEKNFAESIDALDRAIQTLSSQNYDRSQADTPAALLQSLKVTVPGMPAVLAAFLQQQEEDREAGAPDVSAYEFQSGDIVGVLEGLLEKFKHEYAALVEAETNREHSFQLMEQHLSSTILKYTTDVEKQMVMLGTVQGSSKKAQADKATMEATLAESKKFLVEIKSTFVAKTTVFQANQQLREKELHALDEAIKVISTPEVADSYTEHMNLAQVAHSAPFSLLQRQGRAKGNDVLRQRAVNILTHQSKALSSEALANAASSISVGPFNDVIDMIENLIAKLKTESASEANHTSWCNDEVQKSEELRSDLTSQVEEYTAKASEANATIVELSNDISNLAAEQARVAKQMAEATAQRSKEKSENEHALSDAQVGIKAVKQAILVLKKFYEKQAGFVQTRQAPEMKEYKGMESNGVMKMLEVIQADLMRLEQETMEEEQQAAASYKSDMASCKADMKVKKDTQKTKELDMQQAEFELSQAMKDLRATNEKLVAATAYYEELKPSCLEVHVSYKDRVAKREQEIAALKEAYDVLDSKAS